MPSQTRSSCTTAALGAGVGPAFTNRNAARVSDDNYSLAVGEEWGPALSRALVLTGYGFEIPQGKVIVGVLAEVERYGDPGDVGLPSAGQTHLVVGNALVGEARHWGAWAEVEAFVPQGGSLDLWGVELDPDGVNASGFGIAVQALLLENSVAYVDSVRLTVFYEEAPAPPAGGIGSSQLQRRRRR